MPIKDQCLGCRKYNHDICNETNQVPLYNSSSCQNYSTTRINLTKSETDKSDVGTFVQSTQQSTSSDYPTPTSTTNQTPTGFKRFFSFEGRIGRGEYALSYLVYFLYCLPMNLMEEYDINPIFALVWLLLIIPMIWMLWAQGAKRCHDRGNSGWFQIIPFYGLWMLFAPGDEGTNEYGVRS